MADEASWDLERFVAAQDPVLGAVRDELRAGRKRTHWMWFVFPQIAGLGGSAMARAYAISGLEEARAYLEHPVLAGRLVECTELALAVDRRTAHEIFASPDDLKFRSSMTLFSVAAASSGSVFARALDRFFGSPDEETLRRLADRRG